MINNLILLENKFNEGLIMTHDIADSKEFLEFELSKSFANLIEIKNNKMYINLESGEFTVKTYIQFLSMINNLGYYISIIKIKRLDKNNKERINNINPQDFKNEYLSDENLKQFIEYDIILEPKFDITHKLKTNILYHVTETKYLDKILKVGLIPKSKNILSTYPERIYLVYNLEDANKYVLGKKNYYLRIINQSKSKHKYPNVEFSILKIELPENDNLIFYEDPNFIDKGIYTYENINPKYITVYEENN